MNGRQMRLERVTKRTYRLTGFRRQTTVSESRRFAFKRAAAAAQGEYADESSQRIEARQLRAPDSPSP